MHEINRSLVAIVSWYNLKLIWLHGSKVIKTTKGRLRFTFTPNGKREFVPRDQVFFLIVVYCLLLLLKNKYFHANFIHKNCSGQFLFSYFLFWEILNLNPTLAVCRKRES